MATKKAATKTEEFPMTIEAVETREANLRKADEDQWKIGEALLIEAPASSHNQKNGRDDVLARVEARLKEKGFEDYKASTLNQFRHAAKMFPAKDRIYPGLGFWAYAKAGTPANLKIIAAKAKKAGVKLGRPFIEDTMKAMKAGQEKVSKAKEAKELRELEQERKALESDLFTAQSRLRFAKSEDDQLAAQREIDKADAALNEVREKLVELKPTSILTDEDMVPVGDNSQAAILGGIVDTMDLLIRLGKGAVIGEKILPELTPKLLADLHPDVKAALLECAEEAVTVWQQIVETLGGEKQKAKGKSSAPSLKVVSAE